MLNFKTRLALTNEAMSAYTYNMLLKNGATIITAKANHNTNKASKTSPEADLRLNVGAKVKLTRNLWIKKGLFNGEWELLRQ